MPADQRTLLQSSPMSSPPVSGIVNPDELVDGDDVDGTPLLTVGCLSVTRTKKLRLAELPCESVMVQVTSVSPTGKSVPEAGEQEATPAPSTASEVDGLV